MEEYLILGELIVFEEEDSENESISFKYAYGKNGKFRSLINEIENIKNEILEFSLDQQEDSENSWKEIFDQSKNFKIRFELTSGLDHISFNLPIGNIYIKDNNIKLYHEENSVELIHEQYNFEAQYYDNVFYLTDALEEILGKHFEIKISFET